MAVFDREGPPRRGHARATSVAGFAIIALAAGAALLPAEKGISSDVLGALLLWTAWLALANAKGLGINFILSVFCLVWVADIAAYFGGRGFGRRKLAPAISPG